MAVQARGKVTIETEECKGCGLCVESCPPKCLELTTELNVYGAHPVRYTGQDCTGCGICLLLPGAGRDHRVPHQGETKGAGAGARRRTCGSFVKAT